MESPLEKWTLDDARETYEISRWGEGYFSVNEQGRVCVDPSKTEGRSVDLKELVDRMSVRGLRLPILFRFGELIGARLREIQQAFQKAIDDHHYLGRYWCAYPIKVNQQQHVVAEVLRHGRQLGFGLEAGSKPELLAVIALADENTPIICNGFKDAEYVETAMLAQKMGRTIFPVVEKFSELEHILDQAAQVGVRPTIGMRVKLAARGSGRWQLSAGPKSKFGLSIGQILRGLDELKSRGMEDCFQLLHFHLGSQVTNIQRIKLALAEAARVYAELAKQGAGLKYLDVGGGLGVDYDGSQTNFESSMNYSLQEYAADVVHAIQTVCDEAAVPHPTIVSESGRAAVAHHSVLVFNVLGVSEQQCEFEPPNSTSEEYEQPLHDLFDAYQNVTARNLQESFHDAQTAFDMAMALFAGGYLPLEQRALAENLFWATCRKIRGRLKQAEFVPEELEGLDAFLSQTYFCNFSLFQSIPDSWAIRQLFPVMPIHRLDERPLHRAVLADVTCDSDGKIDRFIDRRDVKRSLPLHEFNGEPYYLGIFLVGAYQEILGDLHNLFGDTNTVHVTWNGDGELLLDLVKGDTVRQVLQYVNFEPDELLRRLRGDIEAAVRQGRLDDAQAGRFQKFYEDGMGGYTYLS